MDLFRQLVAGSLFCGLLALLGASCVPEGACNSDGDCKAGQRCAAGRCKATTEEGGPQDASPPTDARPSDRPSTGPAARQLYATYCALCHGDKGEGYKADGANALNNQHFLSIASDAFLRSGIERGRPGTPMSAWGKEYGGPLDDSQIDALVTLIRSWQTVKSVKVDDMKVNGQAARGALQYEFRCATCHGDKGQGGTYMSLNNPVFLKDASDGFLHYSIAKGRPGTPMPAYEKELTPQALQDLVALLRSWQADAPKPKPLPPRTYEPLVINPNGPEPSFKKDERFVKADDVKKALDDGAAMILADARPPADYIKDHIQGAISTPFYEAEKYFDKLPKDRWIVAYCACPHAESGIVYDKLKKAGYTLIKVINEGYIYWKDKKYPTKAGPNP